MIPVVIFGLESNDEHPGCAAKPRSEIRIVAFVDTNPAKQGTVFCGATGGLKRPDSGVRP